MLPGRQGCGLGTPARAWAVSDVYNTLHFATPLVELPIDRVTEAECCRATNASGMSTWVCGGSTSTR